MKDNRPVNLNLFTIKFPVPAIVSILHRLSGLLLVLAIPLLVWMLQQSLASTATFTQLQQCLTTPFGKITVWILLSALIYHLFAGTRHLLLDMGIGESLQGGRCIAWTTISLSVIAIILLGYWLW